VTTAWLQAAGAIACEIIATLSLRGSAGFTRPLLVVLVVIGYVGSFYLLGRALTSLSVGQVYAVWSAVGTAAVAVAGFVLFGDRIGWWGVGGIVLIIAGVGLLTLAPGSSHGG
jgi:small multidrug resistance pump